MILAQLCDLLWWLADEHGFDPMSDVYVTAGISRHVFLPVGGIRRDQSVIVNERPPPPKPSKKKRATEPFPGV